MSCSVTTRRWRVTWRTSRTFGKPACPGTRRRRVSRAEVARVVADLASEADHESQHQHQARSEHALNRPYSAEFQTVRRKGTWAEVKASRSPYSKPRPAPHAAAVRTGRCHGPDASRRPMARPAARGRRSRRFKRDDLRESLGRPK